MMTTTAKEKQTGKRVTIKTDDLFRIENGMIVEQREKEHKFKPSAYAYRRLATMASDETVSPHVRIEAEKAACEVAVAIVKLQFEEPIILNDVCMYVCMFKFHTDRA
jgi:hypothetical protein